MQLLPPHSLPGSDLLLDAPSAVQMVEQEYEELYPGHVAAVHLVYDNRPLRKMQGEYAGAKQKMLDLVDKYASLRARSKPVKRKTVRSLAPARQARLQLPLIWLDAMPHVMLILDVACLCCLYGPGARAAQLLCNH